MARKPIIKIIAVKGMVEIASLIFAIFVELYLKNMLPAERNKIDLARE